MQGIVFFVPYNRAECLSVLLHSLSNKYDFFVLIYYKKFNILPVLFLSIAKNNKPGSP